MKPDSPAGSPALESLRLPGALVLIFAGALGLIGLADVFTPVSLPAQFVGVAYVVAALTACVSALILRFASDAIQIGSAAVVGGAAGFYVTITMAIDAKGYRVTWFYALSALAVLCLILVALAVCTGVLARVGTLLKTIGVSAGVLASAAQFWYTSIYLPANTDVGVDLSASIGTPLRVSRSLTLVPLQLVLRNDSSLTAMVLTSMYTVAGLHYPIASAPPALLTIGHVIDDGAPLFPTANKLLRIIVPVLGSRFQALNVTMTVYYARQARLNLGSPLRSAQANGCNRTYWSLRQSKVHRFTRGTQILVTNWCEQPDHDYVNSQVIEMFGSRTSAAALMRGYKETSGAARQRNYTAYGLAYTTRPATFLLHIPATSPRPVNPGHLG